MQHDVQVVSDEFMFPHLAAGTATPMEEVLAEINYVKGAISAIKDLPANDPERMIQLQRLPGLEAQLAELRNEKNRLAGGGELTCLPVCIMPAVARRTWHTAQFCQQV